MSFHKIDIEKLNINPFTELGRNWALLSAGGESGCNTMTVSWGGMGQLWNKNVITVYVRPQRYTKEWIDKCEHLTLSFYDETQRNTLSYLGQVSGRDEDKITKSGLTPVFDHDTVYFEEARLVFVCRKLSCTLIGPEDFVDSSIDGTYYPDRDYHTMYIAEILEVLVRDESE